MQLFFCVFFATAVGCCCCCCSDWGGGAAAVSTLTAEACSGCRSNRVRMYVHTYLWLGRKPLRCAPCRLLATPPLVVSCAPCLIFLFAYPGAAAHSPASHQNVPVVIVRNKMDTLVAEGGLGERSVDLERQVRAWKRMSKSRRVFFGDTAVDRSCRGGTLATRARAT